MKKSNIKPMPLVDILEKVREGCQRYMYRIDEEGQCSESDDYVVALAFFDDYIERTKEEEENSTICEAEWGRGSPKDECN